MSSLIQKSDDFEQLRKILSVEVHNAVKSAVSDLPSVVYQTLVKLSPLFDQGNLRASNSGVIPTSVPKCRNINTKQISNSKLKCFDDKPKEDAEFTTENLPLSNLRFVMIDSASSTRSVSDSNTSIVSSYCPSRRRSNSRFITLAQDKSSLKRRKIPTLPSTEFSGLWCYQKRKQRWIMVSKYGRNICRHCFAPVHQQKRNCTDSNTSLPTQCSQMVPLKEDKATNTNVPTNTFSRIPISVSKVTEEIMKRRNVCKSGSDSKSSSNSGSTQFGSELSFVPVSKQQAHIGVQTDYDHRDGSSQTTISSKPESVEHSVQTYKNERIPRVTHNTLLLTTRSYIPREKEKPKKSTYFPDKYQLV